MLYSRLQAQRMYLRKAPMDILCIQHVPFEGPAAIAEWANSRGHSLKSVLAPDFFASRAPETSCDALVLMGGPMSANDTATIPWLAEESAFLERQLKIGRKMLGICLGAQMLARTLGGSITRNPSKEIGWFPVTAITPHALTSLAAGQELRVFHWHGETFSIPSGAIHLLRSALCENQAFVWRDQVLALQCHPEMTATGITALSAESKDELQSCGIPEDGRSLQGTASDFESAHSLLFRMLDIFFITKDTSSETPSETGDA